MAKGVIMTTDDYSDLLKDKVIHERSRLLILSYLTGSETGKSTFMELQKTMGFSRGNLSIQIKKLQEANYVRITKKFKDNKPMTTIFLTENGRSAIKNYLKEMENIINELSK
jgi:DNA-binding MarR family transcriptional regulator